MGSLTNQVAIVTGGAQGIGGATSRRLAESGAKILIADMDVETAQVNIERIRNAGGVAEVIETDVSRRDDIEAMVNRAVELWSRLDILVNNAFNTKEPDGSAVDLSEEAWDYAMNVLVKSMFLGAKYAVPEIQKSGKGSIINISSVHGLLMAPKKLVYEAGKSSVIGVTRQMAIDFGPMGIRVNAICPGHIVTERIEAHWKQNPSLLRFFEAQYPVRRVGRPIDIANAINFLCSDEASFITGHALAVDGGLTIQLQEDFGVGQARFYQDHPDTDLSTY